MLVNTTIAIRRDAKSCVPQNSHAPLYRSGSCSTVDVRFCARSFVPLQVLWQTRSALTIKDYVRLVPLPNGGQICSGQRRG